jgi:lysophospholipase L1-like esterase
MKGIRGFVVAVSVAALTLPAAVAMPSTTTKAPRGEIAALKAKVTRLEAANKRLHGHGEVAVHRNHQNGGSDMPRGRLGRWSCTGLALAAFLLIAPASAGTSSVQQGGLYVALGDSIAAGVGASSLSKSYVQLYYGYLQSSGSGATSLLNLSRIGGPTSTDLHNQQLGSAVTVINQSSDTKAVTIDIGANDLSDRNCPTANAPTCPFAANLRAILAAVNEALATDPGDETVQVMEYYNPDIGTPNESARRQMLLGSDGKIDCSGTGAALGLNDLIHCISIEQGAKPIDVLPIFDAAGEAFLASDHLHPNDAGHLAIAKAFGGAATPAAPPPPPCRVPKVTGKQLKSAIRLINRAHCSLGRISYRYAAARKGTVLAQRPRPGLELANRTTVSITVSRGRKGGL